jgi:CheY-like chemotaxis protein
MSANYTIKGNILIVDDNPANLDLLSGMLFERDYKVRVATSGRWALDAVRSSAPDLIMLDINMPGMDGYEVCRQLKADINSRDIPVIFISAMDEAMDKVKAFEVGGIDYVTKPFQIEEVLARIENQLKISKLQREMEHKNAELARKNEELMQSHKRAEWIFATIAEVKPGTVLDGKYCLEKKIGSGGFGAVYRATHIGLDRPVAIKIFRPQAGSDLSKDLQRFRLEGISSCRINHPNAILVLDSGVSAEGIAYLVMELLEGQTLAEEIYKKGRLLPERCAEILIPVCNVLAQAHAEGIIHRDIKPGNIFLQQTRDGEMVKVLDFGIAKLLDDASALETQDLTQTGELIGTPAYMSPERLQDRSYDGRADVYSLGIILYHMLSGRLPFSPDSKGSLGMAVMHITKKPQPLREIDPDITEAMEAIVMRTLAKEPGSRPTAEEMAQELEKIRTGETRKAILLL